MASAMKTQASREASTTNTATPPVAALEHLTGPMRGTTTWIAQNDVSLALSPRRIIHIAAGAVNGSDRELIAHFRRSGETFEIEATGDPPVWVNGKAIRSVILRHHDMIEFGDSGPMSRYVIFRHGQSPHPTIFEVLSDAVAYLRSSHRPLSSRILIATEQVLRRLTRETTILFRIGVVAALSLLAAVAYQQARINKLLHEQIQTGTAQIERFSRTLARTSEQALTPEDLEALRQELGKGLVTTAERLSELERLTTTSARVIAQSRSSIVFLQGSYGFRHKTTGQMLRLAVSKDGRPMVLPDGTPLLSLEGEGPVAERQFVGSGFVIGEDGVLVTNRHLGVPWEHDASVTAYAGQQLEPAIIKFLGYLPGSSRPEAVTLIRTSSQADVAILRFESLKEPVPGLPLAEKTPVPGDEVIVMGYPTGMRSLLAQAGDEFIKELQKIKELDFWGIAERLAASGRIEPLASRGIVGQASSEAIAYDAATTRGGSGGPVLDVNGAVVAVNSAILPEFGGSNLGVPIDKVRQLMGELAVK